MQLNLFREIIVDNFAGGGVASTGICSIDLKCAVESRWKNGALHDERRYTNKMCELLVLDS
jgi:hypothetical protein